MTSDRPYLCSRCGHEQPMDNVALFQPGRGCVCLVCWGNPPDPQTAANWRQARESQPVPVVRRTHCLTCPHEVPLAEFAVWYGTAARGGADLGARCLGCAQDRRNGLSPDDEIEHRSVI